MRHSPKSDELYRRALRSLVGGVNSPVRAFKSVSCAPVFISHGRGAHIVDMDGNDYVDYVGSWGAMILGHAHPAVTTAIQEQAGRGTSYGMSTELEAELAELIRTAFPSMERVRFVSSGTEATMSAIRLARAFTKRDLILKFEGCYHGHADSFLSQAGSGLATLGIAASPGVPESLAGLTLNVPYNNSEAVQQALEQHRGQVAAIIVEPVAANMGVVSPRPGFLQQLRELCNQHGALLIFDEVITGFRLAFGGAQELYKVVPDLTTLGKIIGGGLPVGAYGGREEVMRLVAPEGPVYQAGTLSGNPLAMRAGIATVQQLQSSNFYGKLNASARQLTEALKMVIAAQKLTAQVSLAGSLLTLFFSASPVEDYVSAKQSRASAFASFFRCMLARGILLPPSQFEAWFVSAAHTTEDIDRTVRACEECLGQCR